MSTDDAYLQSLVDELVSNQTDADIIRMLSECAKSQLHEIFARDRWYDISDLDFVKIAPALLLASNILVSERALHFWHIIFFGRSEMERDKHGVTRRRMKPMFSTSVLLPPIERAKVLRMLEELSLAVRLRPAELHHANANCQPEPSWVTSIPFFGNSGWDGRPSIISLSQDGIDEIQPAEMTGISLLRRWLCMAFTMVHEVAHAVWAALRDEMEGLFGDDIFCEMGASVQKWLLGGQTFIATLSHNHGEVLGITKLPNSRFIRGYRRQGLAPLLGLIPHENELIWKVDDAWVKAMFLRKTWTEMIPLIGVISLAPPTTPCGCSACDRIRRLDQPAMSSIDPGQTATKRAICTTRCGCLVHDPSSQVGGSEEEDIQWMLGLNSVQLARVPEGEWRVQVLETRARFVYTNVW